MKRFNLAAVLLALGLLWQAPAFAQVTGMSRIVGTCGTAVYTAGKFNYPTQDTTGAACGNASGSGGGGVAGFTAEAIATAVAAGTNKPASEDTANGAQRIEICKPGATTCIDPTTPSGIYGLDGSTIMSTANPFATQLTAGSAVIGHVINDAGSALIGKVGIDQTTLGTTNAVAIKDTNNVAPDFTLTSPVGVASVYPGKNTAGVFSSATPETCASGNVANATVACTLATASAKTTYITGFTMTADGATVGLAVSCTLTGTITGTMTYTFGYPIGVAVPAQPLNVQFTYPVPASATNTTIVVSCPASGTGGTNAAISATGFLL